MHILGLILIVLFALLGGIPAYGPTGTPYGWYGTGPYDGGVLDFVLIVVLILVFLGQHLGVNT